MEYRQLGRSGLRVSAITLGTMGFGGTGWATPVGQIDVAGARRQIGLARDAGVNLFDTADVYSNGLSEEILGKALGADRDEVLVATKVRLPMGDGPNDAGLSRHHIIRSAEASLRRLGTDYIDLYQVHEWDGQTPLEETLQALDDLVRWGKVRYVGCSNYAAWQLMKALWTADRNGLTPFVSNQVYYSLQARDIENEIVPLAIDQGIGILVWSPIAGYDQDKLYDTVEALVAIGEDLGVSAAQVALAYTMAKPAVTSVIVGARTEEQLADNLAAADLTLPGAGVERLDKVSAQPLPYPLWHQTRNASERFGPADLILLSRHVKS
jgi:aryl-alcohol dehydrogenase-like predicted oxidoreductase